MANSDDGSNETPTSNQLPDSPRDGPSVFQMPAYPPYYSLPPIYPPAREPGALEHWRVPLIVALVAVFLIFGVLDVSSLFFHPAQNSGVTRPLIVQAQIEGDPTPAAHPDLGLAPDALAITCGDTGRITVTNRSARPLQWIATTDNNVVTFSTDTPQVGLLAPGRSITLLVRAFSQPGTYLLHFTDDHGEAADVTVQVSC
jgi:hypothetical protein